MQKYKSLIIILIVLLFGAGLFGFLYSQIDVVYNKQNENTTEKIEDNQESENTNINEKETDDDKIDFILADNVIYDATKKFKDFDENEFFKSENLINNGYLKIVGIDNAYIFSENKTEEYYSFDNNNYITVVVKQEVLYTDGPSIILDTDNNLYHNYCANNLCGVKKIMENVKNIYIDNSYYLTMTSEKKLYALSKDNKFYKINYNNSTVSELNIENFEYKKKTLFSKSSARGYNKIGIKTVDNTLEYIDVDWTLNYCNKSYLSKNIVNQNGEKIVALAMFSITRNENSLEDEELYIIDKNGNIYKLSQHIEDRSEEGLENLRCSDLITNAKLYTNKKVSKVEKIMDERYQNEIDKIVVTYNDETTEEFSNSILDAVSLYN